MILTSMFKYGALPININMRCIEIELSAVYANADCGLTLT